MIVVDYLQIVQAPGRDIKDQVSYTAKALRAFAKSENVAVVQLSQLSRPKGKDINARPSMIDLKETGSIEETSHVVLLPYMPLNDEGKFAAEQELIIGKSRNGSVGSLPVYFDTKRLQFKIALLAAVEDSGTSATELTNLISGCVTAWPAGVRDMSVNGMTSDEKEPRLFQLPVCRPTGSLQNAFYTADRASSQQ